MLDLLNGNLINGNISAEQYEHLMKRISGGIGIDIRDINKSFYEFYAKDGGNFCKPPKACDSCVINLDNNNKPLCKKRY